MPHRNKCLVGRRYTCAKTPRLARPERGSRGHARRGSEGSLVELPRKPQTRIEKESLTQTSPIDPSFYPGYFGSTFSQLDAHRRGRWRRGKRLGREKRKGVPQRHTTSSSLLGDRGGAPLGRRWTQLEENGAYNTITAAPSGCCSNEGPAMADRIPQTHRTTNLLHAGTGSDSLLALDAFVQPVLTLHAFLLLFILFNLTQLGIQILNEARW